MSDSLRSFLALLIHLGYLGPLALGVLDSSFLILPFGNDLLVVGLVARHHAGLPWYALSAACGSTLGALALALVAHRFGEEGIRKLAGKARFEKLKKHMAERAGFLVALACIAPPPFPFTMVIAAASALDYSLWRLLGINFLMRLARFVLLGYLAVRFGAEVLRIAGSSPFRWSMAAFIALCFVASGLSIWHWIRATRRD